MLIVFQKFGKNIKDSSKKLNKKVKNLQLNMKLKLLNMCNQILE